MLLKVLKKVVGSKNDRELKRLQKVVNKINGLEEEIQSLSDEQLSAKTPEFKQRLAEGETLDKLLPEAFACVREAAKRTLGMRHFDVQLIGGMVLHEGKIAEMRTGEGKTLVATLPVYLNALTGDGVHVVTVNDYLASRDANWMRPVYEMLGLTVGINISGQDLALKQASYQCDITYGTNNEFGFDYLRDNMALRLEDRIQRGQAFAIVDEVDSILIDEARTPLIISGAVKNSSELYIKINRQIPRLIRQEGEIKADDLESHKIKPGDYIVDEKHRQVELTEQGHQRIEEMLIREGLLEADDSLYSASNLNLFHHVMAGLRAHVLFHRDVEYIVEDDQVVLIDEHSGRKMLGRRLSEGLHQAIEAKENVSIQSESQTLASTTFQNYFRQYRKLSGMTGTADTEAPEFLQIYGLAVVVIPTNVPSNRRDLNDLIYLSKEEKFEAVIRDIEICLAAGAPVLVGTSSVDTSEEMSKRLKKANIKHSVLNAKYHEREAEIIAQAGRPGTVTIATNMAGRGTDIVLGGNWEVEVAALENPSPEQIEKIKLEWKQRHDKVMEAGGLHILGTERHESRRIDNQLRGRAGRQGDPGVSRFYLSMEDDLMRIFASDKVKNMMQMLGMEYGEAIEHKMVTNSIEKAQRKVEGRNFDIRKQLLEYDDVASDQRRVIYQQRNDILESEDIHDIVSAVRHDVVNDVIDLYIPPNSLEEQWDLDALQQQLQAEFHIEAPVKAWLEADSKLNEKDIREKIEVLITDAYEEKWEDHVKVRNKIEKQLMLQILDNHWKEHLSNMDHLRQGIGLRAYAQKNPKQEYKRESFEMFEKLLDGIKHEFIRVISKLKLVKRTQEEREAMERERLLAHQQMLMEQGADTENEPAGNFKAKPMPQEARKIGRNEPCPCGSGKKFKQCHGRLA